VISILISQLYGSAFVHAAQRDPQRRPWLPSFRIRTVRRDRSALMPAPGLCSASARTASADQQHGPQAVPFRIRIDGQRADWPGCQSGRR